MESTSSIGGSSCRQGPTASGSPYQHTGCGSVWLERVVWDHEAAGSNPVTPIKKTRKNKGLSSVF